MWHFKFRPVLNSAYEDFRPVCSISFHCHTGETYSWTCWMGRKSMQILSLRYQLSNFTQWSQWTNNTGALLDKAVSRMRPCKSRAASFHGSTLEDSLFNFFFPLPTYSQFFTSHLSLVSSRFSHKFAS